MKFINLNALASLPYFRLAKGKIHLRSGIVEHGIADMHAHLGWHYLFTPSINLWAKGEVKHFFPSDIPINLDRYTAFDFTDQAKKICRKELLRGAYNIKGFSSTHTVPNLLEEMDRLSVSRSTLLAVDYPAFSRNSSDYLDAVSKKSESRSRLPVFVSLHPLQRHKEKTLQSYISRGAKGIKLHPQMQFFRASDGIAHPIYRLAAKYRLPVIFHTGLSPVAPAWQRPFVLPESYEKTFAAFPETTFIIGHGGGVEGYEWSSTMAKRYHNVFVEISGQSPKGIEYLVTHMDTDKILYGSDWPFYPMVLPLAKTLLATEKHKKARKKIFWENANKLLQI